MTVAMPSPAKPKENVLAPPVYSSGPSVPSLVALAVGFAGQSGPGHFPTVVG
jgi:hypothetical protein